MDAATYSETARGIIMTKERALAELRSHNIPQGDYNEALTYACVLHRGENGCRYSADRLLAWLGY